MSCEQQPKRRVLGPFSVAVLDNTLGLQSGQNARFTVWGFDPRLNVAVQVYWQQTTPTGILPTNGTANDTNKWSAKAVTRDGRGTITDLNTIFSLRNLPDGYEFNTGAEGIGFDLSTIAYTTNVDPKDDAQLWVLIEVTPAVELPAAFASELMRAVSVDLPKALRLQQLT